MIVLSKGLQYQMRRKISKTYTVDRTAPWFAHGIKFHC